MVILCENFYWIIREKLTIFFHFFPFFNGGWVHDDFKKWLHNAASWKKRVRTQKNVHTWQKNQNILNTFCMQKKCNFNKKLLWILESFHICTRANNLMKLGLKVYRISGYRYYLPESRTKTFVKRLWGGFLYWSLWPQTNTNEFLCSPRKAFSCVKKYLTVSQSLETVSFLPVI